MKNRSASTSTSHMVLIEQTCFDHVSVEKLLLHVPMDKIPVIALLLRS